VHFLIGLRPGGDPDSAGGYISAAAAAHRRLGHSPGNHARRPGDADGAAQPHLPQRHKGMVLHHVIRWSSFVLAAAAASRAHALPRTACCWLLMSATGSSAAHKHTAMSNASDFVGASKLRPTCVTAQLGCPSYYIEPEGRFRVWSVEEHSLQYLCYILWQLRVHACGIYIASCRLPESQVAYYSSILLASTIVTS
jgi:hypothetical protein